MAGNRDGRRSRRRTRRRRRLNNPRTRVNPRANVQRPGVSFGRNNPFYIDNRRETFNHRKAIRELRDQLKRTRQKCEYLFNRLEATFGLLRQQKKRYADVTEGKFKGKNGADIIYKFVCGACNRLYPTFDDLMTHIHKHAEEIEGDETPVKCREPEPDGAAVDEFSIDEFDELTL